MGHWKEFTNVCFRVDCTSCGYVSATVPLVSEDHFFNVREKRVLLFIHCSDLIKPVDDYFCKFTRSQTQIPSIVLVG